MKYKTAIFLISILMFGIAHAASHPHCSEQKRQALYHSLDPTSISEHLAFYELYKDSQEGNKALMDAWCLLSGTECQISGSMQELSFPQDFRSFIELINPGEQSKKEGFIITDSALACIEEITRHLPHRKLKGHAITEEKEILPLSSHDIDLAKALFISQFGSAEDGVRKQRIYEAALDLMALQVLARIGPHATNLQKIHALNNLIFYEMGFRFPPHSIYSNQIDRFTFLPYVIESRRGVCLGVSTMYLCLAQRLNLPLEIVTPPGHIYIRYNDGTSVINIETTLRGVDIRSDEYLDISMKSLETRNMKEVIGMAFFNQASIWLNRAQWKEAKEAYEKALIYMPWDTQVKTLLGCCLLILGENKRAEALLTDVVKNPDPTALTQDTLANDILSKNANADAILALFSYVDETHESIVKKKDALEVVCKKHPLFRSALFQLAICWLQLQRPAKAIEILEHIHTIDPTDITVEYYLAILYMERYNAPRAWQHFEYASRIALQASCVPISLKQLEAALKIKMPKS
jgi:tetratricopeptide (TPR) repeat protein